MQSLQSAVDSRKDCKARDLYHCFPSWKWFQKCYLVADTFSAEVTLIHKGRKSMARTGQFCLVMFRSMWPRERQDWHLQLSCHCRQATLSFTQGNIRFLTQADFPGQLFSEQIRLTLRLSSPKYKSQGGQNETVLQDSGRCSLNDRWSRPQTGEPVSHLFSHVPLQKIVLKYYINYTIACVLSSVIMCS